MRILGVDFGIAKIGLAIADNGLAQPLKVIKNHQATLDKIKRIIEKEKIERIVVGVSEGKVGQKARKYGRKLEKTTGLKVFFQDETLTTKEAIAKMIEAGKRKKYRQEKEDAFAAAIILQTYLDKQNV
jgi:putative Holliday junction resolvase